MTEKNPESKYRAPAEGIAGGKTKKRSPNFPCIDLEKALELTERIYSVDKRAPIPVNLLIARWGLPKYNSYVRQLIAALTYYGLLESSGKGDKRRVEVSDRGYRILEKAPDRTSLLRTAALEPKLFNEVWQHYKKKGLPSNDVIERDLVWQNSFANTRFTKNGAKTFVSNLKSTINFARILPDNVMYGEDNKSEVIDVMIHEQSGSASTGSFRRLDLTLGSGEVATIQIPTSITMKEIKYLQDGINLISGDLFPETKDDGSK